MYQKSDEQIPIRISGVTKKFGDNVAVNDVSFDVLKGEVVGFLGPNGSGKTTTMRLITSFYTPDSGTVLIDGLDNQHHDMETRKKIGYLPENNPLYGDMLVKEYLDFIADLRGLSGRAKQSSIHQGVAETGIEEVYYKPISQCSKGYRQRVGLAQAILHRPEILIMDEPTEGLDPNQRVPIRELIRRMGGERTVLLSTHVLPEVEEICSRLLIISRGKIVGDGTVGQIISNAQDNLRVDIEVEGEAVESTLLNFKQVESVRNVGVTDGRQKYVLSIRGEEDIRPEIFKLAKERGWVIWELHQEALKLEDVFRSLTSDQVLSNGLDLPNQTDEESEEQE